MSHIESGETQELPAAYRAAYCYADETLRMSAVSARGFAARYEAYTRSAFRADVGRPLSPAAFWRNEDFIQRAATEATLLLAGQPF